MATDPEKEIVESNVGAVAAINDYLALPVSPKFGLLVSGAWGSGKTHTIQALMEPHKCSGKRALFVSFYGVASKTDIDRQIFQQLHPILGNPKVRAFGRLLSSVVSASFPMGVGNGALGFSTSELNIDHLATHPVDQVIVFDDLERSYLPVIELLGYINGYVEESGLKVIACANEVPLLSGNHAEDYKQQREKVFGAVVRIEPDFDAAFGEFIRLLSPRAYEEFVRRHVNTIRSIFTESDYGNLRALRQALLLFQRVFGRLPEQALGSDEFTAEFMSIYLILALENSHAVIDSTFIQEMFAGGSLKRLLADRSKQVPPSRADIAASKYAMFHAGVLRQSRQSTQFWEDLFVRGFVNEKALGDIVFSHHLFQDSRKPNWIRLWWWYELPESEILPLVEHVRVDLDASRLTNVFEILHATSVVLDLATRGLVPGLTAVAWLERCPRYFAGLTTDEAFGEKAGERMFGRLNLRGGYAGLGFTSHVAGFEKLRQMAVQAYSKRLDIRASEAASRLLRFLEELEVDEFAGLLNDLRTLQSEHRVFTTLDPLIFLARMGNLQTLGQWQSVTSAISEYRSFPGLADPEIQFFTRLGLLVEAELAALAPSVRREGLQLLREAVETAVH